MNDVPCGKLLGISNSDYHATDAVTSTRLKIFAERPSLYHAIYIARTQPGMAPTKDKDLGTMFHALMESADAFGEIAVLNTRFENYKTKEAQNWRDEVRAAGRLTLEPDDLSRLMRMKASVEHNPTAFALLQNTEAEVSWRKRVGNFIVQARTDRWSEKGITLPDGEQIGPYFLDFKTTGSLAEGEFQKEIAERHYDWQAEYYKLVINAVRGEPEGAQLPRQFLVASEKTGLCDAEVFEIDEESQLVARSGVILALRRFKKCHSSNIWPGRPQGITSVGLPGWRIAEARRDLEEMRMALE